MFGAFVGAPYFAPIHAGEFADDEGALHGVATVDNGVYAPVELGLERITLITNLSQYGRKIAQHGGAMQSLLPPPK